MTVKTKSNEKTTSVISQAILVKILVKILKQFWLKYGFRHQALCIDCLIFASKNPCNQMLYLSKKYDFYIYLGFYILRLTLLAIKKRCKIDERWLRK